MQNIIICIYIVIVFVKLIVQLIESNHKKSQKKLKQKCISYHLNWIWLVVVAMCLEFEWAQCGWGYLHATFTFSDTAYADAALARCVTNASSPKYCPLPKTEISTSPFSCTMRMDTEPSSMKYIPSAASPITRQSNFNKNQKEKKNHFYVISRLCLCEFSAIVNRKLDVFEVTLFDYSLVFFIRLWYEGIS